MSPSSTHSGGGQVVTVSAAAQRRDPERLFTPITIFTSYSFTSQLNSNCRQQHSDSQCYNKPHGVVKVYRVCRTLLNFIFCKILPAESSRPYILCSLSRNFFLGGKHGVGAVINSQNICVDLLELYLCNTNIFF